MAFHNVRLPDTIERGSQGGPQFKTAVQPLDSGYEKRNIEWSKSRGEWDVGYGIRNSNDLAELIQFFYVRMGRAHTFRFKDWTDFKMVDSICGTGDGVTLVFQAHKSYTSGGSTFLRKITKLVGTIVVKVNGVVSAAASVDLDTGVITFSPGNAPGNGAVVTISGQFDCHVRFDTDKLNITAEQFEAGMVPDVPLVEIKE